MVYFSKSLFIILLNLIIFNGKSIYGLDVEELSGIDVLAQLNNKVPKCKLRDFLIFKNQFKTLSNDLKTHCSLLESEKSHRILCHMLAYELEKACGLTSKLQPSPAVYVTPVSSETICANYSKQSTNQWIWNKITKDGRYDIGVNASDLCTTVTKHNDTLRLARFFYKIAPRVRYADTITNAKG